MKALITGGAGFIGSHLSEALLKKGHKVNVVDNLSTGRLENIQHLRDKPDFSFVEGDILDESLMESQIAEADEIYHLAAVVGVRSLMEHGIKAFKTNVNGTEIVLRLASREKKKVLFASSSNVCRGRQAGTGRRTRAFGKKRDLKNILSKRNLLISAVILRLRS